MSRPSAPVLTVRSGSSQGSFAAGRDVVVGSDLRADLRVAHPLVGRAHLLLRFEQDRWIALDNDSPNGVFANGQRVPRVDIHDGQTINLGRPDGPRITFEVGLHRGIVGLLPPTDTLRAIPLPPEPAPGGVPPPPPLPKSSPPAATDPRSRPPPVRRPSRSDQPPPVARAPYQPDASQRTTAVPIIAQADLDSATDVAPQALTVSKVSTGTMDARGPGESAAPVATSTIGRAHDNDVVIHDVLASCRHAVLTPTPWAPRSATPRPSTGYSSTVSGSGRRYCPTAMWSRSATWIWCSPAASWCAAPKRRRAPAAWRFATSISASTESGCSKTSR